MRPFIMIGKIAKFLKECPHVDVECDRAISFLLGKIYNLQKSFICRKILNPVFKETHNFHLFLQSFTKRYIWNAQNIRFIDSIWYWDNIRYSHDIAFIVVFCFTEEKLKAVGIKKKSTYECILFNFCSVLVSFQDIPLICYRSVKSQRFTLKAWTVILSFISFFHLCLLFSSSYFHFIIYFIYSPFHCSCFCF